MFSLDKLLFSCLFFTYVFSDTCFATLDTYEEDRRENKNQLKIMQYNVEWMFIDYYETADCPGNGCTWKNISHSTEHLNKVSDIINKFNPDIINICEIEGYNEMNLLNDEISSELKPYLIKGTDTSTGQNVGMLTKIDPVVDLFRTENKYDYPIEGSQCGYTGSGSTGVSKHYITLFNWNDINVAYIGVHLLAYPDRTDRCVKREGQAKIIEQEIIKYTNDGYEIVLIGDFNDYDNEIIDLNDDKPISQVLDILKGEQSSDFKLFNVNEKIDKDERYSNWWDKNDNCYSTMDEFVLIDHILLSEKLYNMVSNVSIYHGYDENCDRMNSDHYPIILDLNF